jgi:hypothetical protein
MSLITSRAIHILIGTGYTGHIIESKSISRALAHTDIIQQIIKWITSYTGCILT